MSIASGRLPPSVRVGVALLVFIVIVWRAVAWLDDPNTRYQRFRPFHEAIYGYEGPIDLVTSGGSRAAFAIQGSILADHLSARYARPVTVVDLAYTALGVEFSYVLLRDLLARREVKIVALELSEAATVTAAPHPLLYRVGTVRDIVEGYMNNDHLSVVRRAQLAGQALARKASEDLARALKGTIVDLTYPNARPSKTLDSTRWIGRGPREAIETYQREFDTWTEADDRTFDFDVPEYSRWRHYIRRCIELTRSHNVKLVLFVAPRGYRPPLHQQVVEAIEKRSGVPLIQMNRNELRSLFPGGLAEGWHVSRSGSRIFLEWLVKVLPSLD